MHRLKELYSNVTPIHYDQRYDEYYVYDYNDRKVIFKYGNMLTKEEKLICADGRKNFDEPGYWELFSEFYYRDTNVPRYCRDYDRPNHAFKTPGKACLTKDGDWEVQ